MMCGRVTNTLVPPIKPGGWGANESQIWVPYFQMYSSLVSVAFRLPIPVAALSKVLRPLASWDCGFEFCQERGYLSSVNAGCCPGRGLWVGRSVVQRVLPSVCHWMWSVATVTLYTFGEQVEEIGLRKLSALLFIYYRYNGIVANKKQNTVTVTLSLCWATRHLNEDIHYCLEWDSNPCSHYSIGPSHHTATVSELETSYFVIKSLSRQQKSHFDSTF